MVSGLFFFCALLAALFIWGAPRPTRTPRPPLSLLPVRAVSFFRPSGSPDDWRGLALAAPAWSIAAWRAECPTFLLLSFGNWVGITSAAAAQGAVLVTPEHFDVARLVDVIVGTPSLRVLVVHGIPPNSLRLAAALRPAAPRLRIVFVYHGNPAAPFHAAESGLLEELIEATRDGVVDVLGVVKLGLAGSLRAMGAPRVRTLPNFPSLPPSLPAGKYGERDGRLHIGLFTSSDMAHKNVAAQVVAACGVPGAVLHVTRLPPLAYLHGCAAALVEAGSLPHGELLRELARMDVLMYVSFTECFPMLLLEGMSVGVPVVVSRTHRVLDGDPVLRQALVAEEADSPDSIRRVLLGAAARAAELRPRLLAHTACLHHIAVGAWAGVESAWEDFAGAEAEEEEEEARTGARAALDGAACAARAAAASGAAESTARALGGAPPATRSMHIAFITYELFPGGPGGAGMVISHLAMELLARGHRVTMLAHAPPPAMAAWMAHMAAAGWAANEPGGRLFVRSVPLLAEEGALIGTGCAPAHIFLRRASIFALAARLAYLEEPFDALEVFEYAGAAYALLWALREWQRAEATVGAEGNAAPPPFLPPEVPIMLRLHGSMQLIHQSEGTFAADAAGAATPPACTEADGPEAWPLMYLMERYALHSAHVLLPQSAPMRRLYEMAYGLPSGRMLVATPPMERILAPMRRGGGGSAWGGGPPPPRGAPATGLRGDTEGTAPAPLRLLIYGRLARMKGSETVARAAALIQAGLPPGTPLELHFAGGDWECSLHAQPTSQCVLEALERGGGGRNVRASFLGAVDRAMLADMVPAFHGAVVASEFETFNLAAHELAATGIPLVVSNIPALAAFFSPDNAYVFEPGDEKSLAAEALALAADLARGAPRVAALDYKDPLEPYGRVVNAARRGELPRLHADTVMEEAAIDRAQAGCWHEEACSSECKKRWAALSSASPETLRMFLE